MLCHKPYQLDAVAREISGTATVVVSALGGTTGSFVVGRTFATFQATLAFYILLIPIAALMLASMVIHRRRGHNDGQDPV